MPIVIMKVIFKKIIHLMKSTRKVAIKEKRVYTSDVKLSGFEMVDGKLTVTKQ